MEETRNLLMPLVTRILRKKVSNFLVGHQLIHGEKKQFHHQGHAGWITNDRNNNNNNNNNVIVGGRNSMYVKVKMEGVPIGRKVDLRLYHSYQLFTQNLLQMFARYQNSGKNSTRFTILYQDREGDWMLAGDVPWKTFVETVQRIEIQKNEK